MAIQTAISDGNLPAEPNSFVGRERDLAELARLLSDVRALTLCGPGGIGKTRLALRLACEVVPDFPDGAWLVELADTDDAAFVARRVAVPFGVREEPDRPLVETLTAAWLRPGPGVPVALRGPARQPKRAIFVAACARLASQELWSR